MQLNEGAQISHVILRGKTSQQVFESEIQKKKILDAVISVQEHYRVRTLAYCVLDNEIHMMIKSRKADDLSHFFDDILLRYEKLCFPYTDSFGMIHRKKNMKNCFRKAIVKEAQDEGDYQTMKSCAKLHFLPIERGISQELNDYWWCSYQDYLGRRWLPVADTSYLLRHLEKRKAAGFVREAHRYGRKYPRARTEKEEGKNT